MRGSRVSLWVWALCGWVGCGILQGEPSSCYFGGSSSAASDSADTANDCGTFYDSTPYFNDMQMDTICWDAGLWLACDVPENRDADCSNLEGLMELGGASGDCPYCDNV